VAGLLDKPWLVFKDPGGRHGIGLHLDPPADTEEAADFADDDRRTIGAGFRIKVRQGRRSPGFAGIYPCFFSR